MVAVDHAINVEHRYHIYDVFRPQCFGNWVILKEIVDHALNCMTSLHFPRMHSSGDDYGLLPIMRGQIILISTLCSYLIKVFRPNLLFRFEVVLYSSEIFFAHFCYRVLNKVFVNGFFGLVKFDELIVRHE